MINIDIYNCMSHILSCLWMMYSFLVDTFLTKCLISNVYIIHIDNMYTELCSLLYTISSYYTLKFYNELIDIFVPNIYQNWKSYSTCLLNVFLFYFIVLLNILITNIMLNKFFLSTNPVFLLKILWFDLHQVVFLSFFSIFKIFVFYLKKTYLFLMESAIMFEPFHCSYSRLHNIKNIGNISCLWRWRHFFLNLFELTSFFLTQDV